MNEAEVDMESVDITIETARANYADVKPEVKVPALVDEDMCYFIMTELEQPLWTIGKQRFLMPEAFRHEVMFETAA